MPIVGYVKQIATRQPQDSGWWLDYDSPLLKGGIYNLFDGHRLFNSKADIDLNREVSAPAYTYTGFGRAILTTQTDGLSAPTVADSTGWTIAAVVTPITYSTNSTKRVISVQELPNSGTADRSLRYTNSVQWEAQIFDGADKVVIGPALSGNVKYHIVITCDGSNLYLYVDGVQYGPTAVNNTGFTGYSSPEFGIGSCGSLNQRDSRIHFAAYLKGAWSSQEAKSWSKNPWQVFYKHSPIFLPTAAGGTTVNAGVDSLLLTEQTASINAAKNIATNVDNLTLSELAANINAAININANVASLTLTEFAAAIKADTSIAANVDTLILTTFAASLGNDVLIDAGIDNLTLSELAASINAAKNIQAAAAGLTLTEYQSAVSFGRTIQANVDALTLTELQAAINAAHNITTNVDNLSLVTYQAGVDAGLFAGTTIDGEQFSIINTAYGNKTYYFNGTNYFTI